MVDERREKDPESYGRLQAAATVFFGRYRLSVFGVPTFASVADYEPRRPDFIEVAGGLLARTGGGAGGCGCWPLVASGTAWDGACGPFFFLEKSGISFFRFTWSTSSRG